MRVFDMDVRDISHEPYWWVRKLGEIPDWRNYDALVSLSVRYPMMYDAQFWCLYVRIVYRTQDIAVLLTTKLTDYVRGRIYAKMDTPNTRGLFPVVHRLMHMWRVNTMEMDVSPVLQRYFSGDVLYRKDEINEKPAWLLPYVRIRLAIPYTPDLPLLRRS